MWAQLKRKRKEARCRPLRGKERERAERLEAQLREVRNLPPAPRGASETDEGEHFGISLPKKPSSRYTGASGIGDVGSSSGREYLSSTATCGVDYRARQGEKRRLEPVRLDKNTTG